MYSLDLYTKTLSLGSCPHEMKERCDPDQIWLGFVFRKRFVSDPVLCSQLLGLNNHKLPGLCRVQYIEY